MSATHLYIRQLLGALAEEEKEEISRYKLDQQHTLKSLKSEGLALHPIAVIRKTFGYADYPEITFRLSFPSDTNQFKDGIAIECFASGEDPIKGVLLSLDGKTGEFRLFAPDFPEWIEDDGVGIKLAPDQRTLTIMKAALNELENNKKLYALFQHLHDGKLPSPKIVPKEIGISYVNQQLNSSQQNAVSLILKNEDIAIIHGPPGTGKTTTLVEAIMHLASIGQKTLVSAPSNTAVDNIARALLGKGVHILRVGNMSKVDEAIFSYTPEGKLSNSRQQKEIKELKKRAEEFRRMALKYKRNFGRAEREQRNLLFKEVKNIRQEIKKLQVYNEEKLFAEAQVILGTPIGLYDAKLRNISFQTLIIDEAGQCTEALAWCIFPFAERYVLAGDHHQLPPTILSQRAAQMGLNKSILEVCISAVKNISFLDTQYRMREVIAGFSGEYFYGSLLQTDVRLSNTGTHLTFIDTAGSGYNETQGNNGMSLQNEGELRVVQKIIDTEKLNIDDTAFISPYSGQVAAAQDVLSKQMRLSTIDSFQGQEKENIIISLVRSNDEGEIGFLKDYRRMNVAVTRAKEKLFIIGDSATIGGDSFYKSFLAYIEKYGNYRSVWEFEM